MLQIRQSQRPRRNLQTTAQIRYQLNQQFYNIQTHNNDTAKRSALVMALFVYVMRLENKELEDSIYTRLDLNESQLQQLALYKERILLASEQEVEQIQNEMVKEIGPLFELDEANLLDLSRQLDPTVPTPMLVLPPPNLAKQKIYCTKYYIDITVGQFHENVNNSIVVLNDNAKDEHDKGNIGKAVALKQHANDLHKAGRDVINGQQYGNVEQVNDGIATVISVQRIVEMAYDLYGTEGVEMLHKYLNNNGSGTNAAGLYGKNGDIVIVNNKNDINDNPVIEQNSNVNYGSGY
ncbi:MAG: hypothetical protein GY821_14100 [Gammaproteobacteria bacterium]|nr:hypothetical protein [Gammaproteobacteria bacterium]